MKLSKRLSTLAQLVHPSDVIVDVGCDHGLLSIELIQQNKANRVLAVDNKANPLLRCQKNIQEAQLEDKIECYLSDGLKQVPTPYQTVIIAGMGGELIRDILKEKLSQLKSCQQLVLSPHSKLFELKQFLLENGFEIECEHLVLDYKLYVHLSVKPTSIKQTPTIEDLVLLHHYNDLTLYKQWLSQTYQQLSLIYEHTSQYQRELQCIQQELIRLSTGEAI